MILGDLEDSSSPKKAQDNSTDALEATEGMADEKDTVPGNGCLVKEEEKDTGVVKFFVYKIYWKSVGSCLAPLVLLSLLLMQGMCSFLNIQFHLA